MKTKPLFKIQQNLEGLYDGVALQSGEIVVEDCLTAHECAKQILRHEASHMNYVRELFCVETYDRDIIQNYDTAMDIHYREERNANN